MKRTFLVILSTLGLVLSLALAQDAQTASSDVAAVRVAHLAPGAADVDILIDGESVLQEVSSGTVSGYRLLPAGDHQIEVVLVGAAAEAAPAATGGQPAPPGAVTGGAADPALAAPLATATITAEGGAYYTIVATAGGAAQAGAQTGGAATGGAAELAPTEGVPSLALTVFTDTFANFPIAGEALVRVIHASADGPAVNLVAMRQEEGGQPAATGGAQTGGAQEGPQPIQGQNLATDLPFGSASEYTSVPAGSYHLQVQTTDGAVALDLPDTLLEPGAAYTFYAFGSAANDTLALNLSVDAIIAREAE